LPEPTLLLRALGHHEGLGEDLERGEEEGRRGTKGSEGVGRREEERREDRVNGRSEVRLGRERVEGGN
jgi:hypothetical protein